MSWGPSIDAFWWRLHYIEVGRLNPTESRMKVMKTRVERSVKTILYHNYRIRSGSAFGAMSTRKGYWCAIWENPTWDGEIDYFEGLDQAELIARAKRIIDLRRYAASRLQYAASRLQDEESAHENK